MTKLTRLGAAMGLLLMVTAMVSSCSSTRQLGCPSKITRAAAPAVVPVQAPVAMVPAA